MDLDRGFFLDKTGPDLYMDAAHDIGFGATMTSPSEHAYVLELLKTYLIPGSRVLDIGSGSGYLVAAFYELLGKEGHVIGIEHI